MNTLYKLSFNTTGNGAFLGQTAFGTQTLEDDGAEVVFQKWCGIEGGLTIMNRGTYGGSYKDGELSVTLLRTPVYSAHPILERPLAPHDRCHEHIDIGEREFEFRLMKTENPDYEADVFNQPPMALSFFPDGSGKAKGTLAYCDNKKILMTSLRGTDAGYEVRLYNSTDMEQNATVIVGGVSENITFGKYEVKTFAVEDKFEEKSMI